MELFSYDAPTPARSTASLTDPRLRGQVTLLGWAVTALVFLLLGSGCASKPGPLAAGPATAPPVRTTTPGPVGVPVQVVTSPPETQRVSGDEAVVSEDVSGRSKIQWDDIFFEFNSFVLSTDARDSLVRDADLLKKPGYAALKITIEGHCDERGTHEFNLALGDKRANAAKDFLKSLGIDVARIKVVSLGKESPIAKGHDEASWALNRRGHIRLQRTDEPSN